MTDRHPPQRRDTHDVSGAGDRHEALVDVLQHEESREAQAREHEERERRRRDRRRPPYWLAAVLAGVAAWLWLFPPSFLRMDPPPQQSVEKEEAALRFVMYVQAQRLEAYRLETGEYPDRLEAAGAPLPSMTYVRLGRELYQLTGSTGRLTLTYASDLPLEDFAGPDVDAILEGVL